MTTNITTDIDNTNTQAWMKEIWDWADANNIPESKIPREADALLRLRELDILFGGYSTHVPDGNGGFREVESRNAITTLPEAINNLKNLKYLRLVGATEIPYGIDKLNSLETLVLLHTSLAEVPEVICRLPNLKSLYVKSRSIKQISDNLGQLSKLEYLDIRGTSIERLPESIGELSQLEELVICQNKLQSLPQSITKLTQLNRFFLSEDNISHLPNSTKDFLEQFGESILRLDKM